MKRRMYAIRDNKVGKFNSPCLFENDAVAVRAFGDLVKNDKNSIMYLHPEDFTLCFLAEIDMENGAIVQEDGCISSLCTASDFFKE